MPIKNEKQFTKETPQELVQTALAFAPLEAVLLMFDICEYFLSLNNWPQLMLILGLVAVIASGAAG